MLRGKISALASAPLLTAAVVAALALGAAAWLFVRGETLSAAATAKQLQSRLRTTYAFGCHRISNDGSITLPHVTYRCDAVGGRTHPDRTGYFVATNRSHIEGIEPLG